MQKVDDQTLLDMGKKHQKWLENTTVNLDAYMLNNNLYYLTTYSNKFSSDTKACAVISKSSNKEEAIQSLLPHYSFSISSNNLLEGAYERTKLDFSLWKDIRDYIKDIIENNTLNETDLTIYMRANEVMTTVIELQQDIKRLWEEIDNRTNLIRERGYFTDEDADVFVNAVIEANMIQYKQIKPQYDYCEDFDVIYANRNKYKSYGKLFNVDLLEGMTSKVAKQDLKQSIDESSFNENVSHLNESELYNRWLKTYEDGLEVRVREAKNMLRYP